MKYDIDKDIIALKKQQRDQIYSGISTGIYVKDQLVTFSQQLLFQNKIKVFLPDNFYDMPESAAVLKYPSMQRPQIIKTDLSLTVNFTFQLVQIAESQKQPVNTETIAEQFRGTLQKINPSYFFYDHETETNSLGQQISWFDFLSSGIDESLYHMITLIAAEDGILLAGFHCLESDQQEWKRVVKEIFLNIYE